MISSLKKFGLGALCLAFLYLSCAEHERDNPSDPSGVAFYVQDISGLSSSSRLSSSLRSSSSGSVSSSSSGLATVLCAMGSSCFSIDMETCMQYGAPVGVCPSSSSRSSNSGSVSSSSALQSGMRFCVIGANCLTIDEDVDRETCLQFGSQVASCPVSSSSSLRSSSSLMSSSSSSSSGVSSSGTSPSSSSGTLCNGQTYNSETEFCYNNSQVTAKCEGKIYSTSQFCHENKIYSRCGTAEYNPSTSFCLGGAVSPKCNGLEYTAAQFCFGSDTYYKCGSASSGAEYNPTSENCCGSNKYSLSNEFCYGTTIYDKCNGLEYTAAQFCFGSDIYDKCGSASSRAEYNPTSENCCGSSKYSLANEFCYGTAIYKKVEIGSQTWMAENLNYNTSGSKCYSNQNSNCEKYGRLYDWATAKTACPSGWHLPSDADWNILMNYVQTDNGSTYTSNSNASIAGKHLKAKSGWNSNGNGLDTYGFAALPGGIGYSDGSFYYAGNYGNWWSASENFSNYAYLRVMNYNTEIADWNYYDKSSLLSVRCLQD